MIYMVCYDIADPSRLRRTAKVLEQSGLRVQKSFFQCDIARTTLDGIITALRGELNLKEDKLYVYPLCASCAARAATFGRGRLIKLEPYEIL